MKYPPKKVFVLENNEYVEITYEELRWRTMHDVTYGNRKFLLLHGMLMDVTPEDYKSFYKADRQQKYLDIRPTKHGDFSMDAPLPEGFNQLLVDVGADVSIFVEQKIMLEMLHRAMAQLREDEQLLIYKYYYVGISQNQLAEQYGITRQSMGERIERICRKLREILERKL